MKIQNKIAFVERSNSDIRLVAIGQELQKKGIITKWQVSKYDNGYCLKVMPHEYEEAVKNGSWLAFQEEYYNVCWLDSANKRRMVGYVPIMYGVLPPTVKGRSSWVAYEDPDLDFPCPDEIRCYVHDLTSFCGVRNIALRFDAKNNAFMLLATSHFSLQTLLENNVKVFNQNIQAVKGIVPFYKIYYPAWDGAVSRNIEEEETELLTKIQSYFNASLFYKTLRHPEGKHIGPHNYYPHLMQAYHEDAKLILDDIHLDSKTNATLIGHFRNFDYKGINDSCVVREKGSFLTNVTLENAQKVTVITSFHVSRKTEGVDLDGQNRRDNFFSCLSATKNYGDIECREYFVKIASGHRLLHYSDDYPAFEIFDIPTGWMVEQGLSYALSGRAKVFDDTTFDMNDPDLREVKEILNKRIQGPKLVLKSKEEQ